MDNQQWKEWFTRNWLLVFILLAGAFLRFNRLEYQSLWLDELHTMNEADPSFGWSHLFNQLKCCDPHPPLHFIVTRIAFTLFGHTELTARMVTAIVGTISIAGMYLLGKEFRGKSLGLIAAAITAINPYQLFYSQEARVYIFAFCFAIFSYLYFLKLVKHPTRRHAIGYGIFSLALLYSHYYSLFVIASQVVTGSILLISDRLLRKEMAKGLLLAGIIMLVGYLPWVPWLLATASVKSFWIESVDHRFFENYFIEYFGQINMLTPVLVVLLLVYVMHVVFHQKRNEAVSLRSDELSSGFLILLSWVFVTLMLPYIRSVSAFPMLYPRYGIVILPAFIIAVSYGIELFHRRLFKILFTLLVAGMTVVNLFGVQDYYGSKKKSQFREMTDFIVKNNKANYPIINEKTSWHHGYYLKRAGSTAQVFAVSKEAWIDSMLYSSKYKMNGFWIAGAHGDPKPSGEKSKLLDSAFILLKSGDWVDAWASLYVKKGAGVTIIPYTSFEGGAMLPDEKVVALWSGSIQTVPINLVKGNYLLTITARGDEGGGEFPHVNVFVNEQKVGDYVLGQAMEQRQFNFQHTTDGDVRIKIELDNDFYEPGKGDRNVFVSQAIVEVKK